MTDNTAPRKNRPAAVVPPAEAETPTETVKITVPAKHPMVAVLGTGDGLLRVIEKHFPGVDIHARGNEITASGPTAEVTLVQRLFGEMLLVLRTGAPLTDEAVARSIALLRSSEDE